MVCSSKWWLGLNMTVAMTFEVGSFAVENADLGFAPKAASYWALILSSLLPMAWIVHGLITSPPGDFPAIFCVLGGLIGGTLRAKEAWQCLSELKFPAKS